MECKTQMRTGTVIIFVFAVPKIFFLTVAKAYKSYLAVRGLDKALPWC